jgi:hypothetical protein
MPDEKFKNLFRFATMGTVRPTHNFKSTRKILRDADFPAESSTK